MGSSFCRARLHTTCLFSFFLVIAGSLAGCSAKSRHKVLSFIFDGVPSPEALVAEEGPIPPIPEEETSARARSDTTPVLFTHAPYENGDCASCHDLNLGNWFDNTSALCYGCHDDMSVADAVHYPVEEGDCRICHDPHQSAYRFQLVFDPRRLCFECHDVLDHVATGMSASTEEGLCTDCHDPHSSSNIFALVESVPALCWPCHDEELMAGIIEHADDEWQGCPKCHSFHGTDKDTPLLEPAGEPQSTEDHSTYGSLDERLLR